MDTTTTRPPSSAGDGAGESRPPKRSNPRQEPSGLKFDLSEERLEEALLGADGEPIPIVKGLGQAVDRGRHLGRAAGASWSRISERAEDAARRNPVWTAFTALGVGVVAGVVVGILFARD